MPSTIEHKPYSVEKDRLSAEEIDALLDLKKIQPIIEANRDIARSASFVREKSGLFGLENFESRFLPVTGAQVINERALTIGVERFFGKDGRRGLEDTVTTNRGRRYLISLDPLTGAIDRSDILAEDFYDALQVFNGSDKLPKNPEVVAEYLSVIDYIKNSTLTILNALYCEERARISFPENSELSELIQEMRGLTYHSVAMYYTCQVGDEKRFALHLSEIRNRQDVMKRAENYIRVATADGRMEAGYLNRPESTHPLLHTAFTYVQHERFGEMDTIIGMPTGATELAMLQCVMQEGLTGKKPDLILLPLSFHSSPQKPGEPSTSDILVARYLAPFAEMLNGKRVMVVDDNASTGLTIQWVIDAIRHNFKPISLNAAVCEADIFRSAIDKDSKDRPNIATEDLYAGAVGIYPISNRGNKKHSLRKTTEQESLVAYYELKLKNSKDENEATICRVAIDALTHRTKDVLASTQGEGAITSFKRTFLSNFAPVDIEFEGAQYPSVEHAYQSQKYDASALAGISTDELRELNEELEARGSTVTLKNLDRLFERTDLNPGDVKVISQHLAEWGYAKSDWQHHRVRVMVALLRQKFSVKKYADLLLATGDTYLVEGNDWGDNFWGYYDEKGENLLGRILMTIREELRKTRE